LKRQITIAGAALALLVGGAVPALAADDEPTCDEARRSVVELDVKVNAAAAADDAVASAEKVAEQLAAARAELAAAVAVDNATVPPLTEDSQRTVDAKALVAELEEKAVAPAELDQLRKLAEASDVDELISLRLAAIEVRDKACDDGGVTTTPPTPTPAPTTEPPADEPDLDCADFPLEDGTTAQEMFERDVNDPHNLDIDEDNVACEVDEDTLSGNVAVPVGGVSTGGW
jgi:hypothetical protein